MNEEKTVEREGQQKKKTRIGSFEMGVCSMRSIIRWGKMLQTLKIKLKEEEAKNIQKKERKTDEKKIKNIIIITEIYILRNRLLFSIANCRQPLMFFSDVLLLLFFFNSLLISIFAQFISIWISFHLSWSFLLLLTFLLLLLLFLLTTCCFFVIGVHLKPDIRLINKCNITTTTIKWRRKTNNLVGF